MAATNCITATSRSGNRLASEGGHVHRWEKSVFKSHEHIALLGEKKKPCEQTQISRLRVSSDLLGTFGRHKYRRRRTIFAPFSPTLSLPLSRHAEIRRKLYPLTKKSMDRVQLIGIVAARRHGKTSTCNMIKAAYPGFEVMEQYVEPEYNQYDVHDNGIISGGDLEGSLNPAEYNGLIISDVRLLSQAQAIQKSGGIVIAISSDSHPAHLESDPGADPYWFNFDVHMRMNKEIKAYEQELLSKLKALKR